MCVVRSSRKQYRMVWAAITFITEIRKLPLFFNLLDLSGKNMVMAGLVDMESSVCDVAFTVMNILYGLLGLTPKALSPVLRYFMHFGQAIVIRVLTLNF